LGHQHPIGFAGKSMLKHFLTVLLALAGSLALANAFAATSIPVPEASFALASNNGGAESITASMSSDMGGGKSNTNRAAEIALETPSGDVSPVASTATRARDDVSGKTAAIDGAAPANSTSTAHKARGNAHWQSLLPGLMK